MGVYCRREMEIFILCQILVWHCQALCFSIMATDIKQGSWKVTYVNWTKTLTVGYFRTLITCECREFIKGLVSVVSEVVRCCNLHQGSRNVIIYAYVYEYHGGTLPVSKYYHSCLTSLRTCVDIIDSERQMVDNSTWNVMDRCHDRYGIAISYLKVE